MRQVYISQIISLFKFIKTMQKSNKLCKTTQPNGIIPLWNSENPTLKYWRRLLVNMSDKQGMIPVESAGYFFEHQLLPLFLSEKETEVRKKCAKTVQRFSAKLAKGICHCGLCLRHHGEIIKKILSYPNRKNL